MTRGIFAVIVIAVCAIAFLGMWLGWRARSRRDAGVHVSTLPPVGDIFAQFTRVLYISTTPQQQPLVRVAVPGLRYRGHATLTVREDGVTVTVAAEQPVHISAKQVQGSGTAARRVGKAVERDGLALLRWNAVADDGQWRALESCFRFDSAVEQRRFTLAVDRIAAQRSSDDDAADTPDHKEQQ